MLGTDIALKHSMAMQRHNDFLAEARRRQLLEEAYGDNRPRRRSWISEARAAIATLFFRAGSWLMPDDGRGQPAGHGFELRLGR